MLNNIRSLLTIIWLLICIDLSASQFAFLKYEVDDGLSNNAVRCVVQDSLGFMWFGTADGLSRFDGKRYRNYFHRPDDAQTLGNGSIHSLYIANGGELWVGTESGIYIYNHISDTFRHFDVKTQGQVHISSRINTITDDGGNHIWIGTQGQGAFIYDRLSGTLIQTSRHASMVTTIRGVSRTGMYVGSEVGTISEFTKSGEFVGMLYTDAQVAEVRNAEISALYTNGDTIWFGMGVRGFREFVRGGQVRSYRPDNGSASFHVKVLYPLSGKELLVGTNSGMYIFDIASKQFRQVTDMSTPFGAYHHSINDIYCDREGGLWIATEYGGVHYLSLEKKIFEQYLSVNSPQTRGGMIVTALCKDKSQNVWVGTIDGGVFFIDSQTGKPQTKTQLPFIANIQCMMLDAGKLWVGTAVSGLYVIDTRSGATINHRHKRYDQTTISDNCVSAILRDRKGNIYVGTAWGLNRYDRKNNSFKQESRTNNQANISDIMEDRRGNIWIATNNIGAFRYTPDKEIWRRFAYNSTQPNSLCSNNVTTLFEDRRGRIWFGTENGMCYYTYKHDNFTPFRPDAGKSDNQFVASIEQDHNGRLWVSGNTGLMCIDIAQQRIINHFSRTDGLQSNQFNVRASLRTKEGKLYFGGVNGLNVFNPENFKTNTYKPEVILTNLYINSREVVIAQNGSALREAIYKTKKLRLNSSQNSIEFDYDAMSYRSPHKNNYRCRLTGRDADWVDMGNRSRVLYSNLPPGRYRFEVMGSNSDGVWNETPAGVDIVITPPFYRTTLAYIIYILLVAGGFLMLIVAQNRRHHRHQREYAIQHEKDAYKAKIDFFTNLAHEIRTPLALIKAPLESIISTGDGTIQTRNYLDIINRNVVNLLNLINQLLDFRKMEEVNYELKLAPCDMGLLVEDICVRFRAAIETGGLQLETDIASGANMCNVDRDAMTKVINNVLVNAVKYASLRVRVSLQAEEDVLRITIEDDGEGVEPKAQTEIFKVFYRASNHKAGTGLGLPLARLLIEKHSGTLKLLPSENGAKFEITVPRDLSNISPEPVMSVIIAPATPGFIAESHPHEQSAPNKDIVVLVIEDNDELRGVVSDIISNCYTVTTACTGREALEVLAQDNTDIIVSDLMMPEMDGYELCEFVKSDMRYSHIPIIQLTAKTSLEDRIKGLEYGADAYLEKPFSPEHLMVQIRNILDNRQRLRSSYGSMPQMGNAHIVGATRKDSEFMEKLNAEILANIGNEDFYIESLAESMFMSRSNFYRKMKALVGVSPNEYLRTFRLEQSVLLLRTGEYAISDIYMHLGFGSISYFSTCFKKHFGVAPTKYIEDYQQSQQSTPSAESGL